MFVIGIAFSPYGKIKLGKDNEKPEFSTAAWGILLGGVAAVLLVAGGLRALQTASIASAFPFMLVMLLMFYSLLKGFSEDKVAWYKPC